MNRIYFAQQDAEKAIPVLQARYRRPVDVPMASALTAYGEKMPARGKRPRTIDTAMSRLRSVVATSTPVGRS